ncbi:MAG TPA: CoA transferase [Acidimicrobiales bacterium]|nr:CoA transferase [Acidimicrobiales bacterium]
MSGRTGPLDGVLVADFSRVVAGPFATMLLGDLGADVVKVERPGAGDDTRGFGPPFVEGESSYYLSVNRNKRSVAWDLGTEEGRRKGRKLAERADVIVENFRPGTAARFGLGYEEIAEANPGVVYCSVSGFGSAGAGASLPGYDFLVQGVGGLMSVTGDDGGEPRKVGVAVVDVLTAQFATNAIVAALYERERSGRGQRVEVNLLSCLLSALINQASTYVTTGTVPRAMGNRHPSIAPYETLQAADRLLVVAVANDAQFAAFAGALGLSWMADDARFARNAERVAHREEMLSVLQAELHHRPAAEWLSVIQAAGIPCGIVNDIAQAFELAEALGLEPVVRLPRSGEAHPAPAAEPSGESQVRNPMGFSRTPISYRLAPPALGEHTAAVETELDLA